MGSQRIKHDWVINSFTFSGTVVLVVGELYLSLYTSTYQFRLITNFLVTFFFFIEKLGKRKRTLEIWLESAALYSVRSVQFSSVSQSCLTLRPRGLQPCQASQSITNSQSLLKLMSTESMMQSNHLILCRPLLLLPSIFPSIRVFSNDSVLRIRWSKDWSFSFITDIIYLHHSVNST